MKTTIEIADQNTINLLDEVKRKYHQDLLDAHFMVLFCFPGATRHGKTVLGKVKKASPTEKALYQAYHEDEPEYVLTLDKGFWLSATERQKMALLDHELCHCLGIEDEDGGVKWSLRGHDIEEFTDVLRRWGAWTDDIIQVVEVLQQLDLFADTEPELAGARS